MVITLEQVEAEVSFKLHSFVKNKTYGEVKWPIGRRVMARQVSQVMDQAFRLSSHKTFYEKGIKKVEELVKWHDRYFGNGKLFPEDPAFPKKDKSGVIFFAYPSIDANHFQFLYTLRRESRSGPGVKKVSSPRDYTPQEAVRAKAIANKRFVPFTDCYGLTHDTGNGYFAIALRLDLLYDEQELVDTVLHELTHALVTLEGEDTVDSDICGFHTWPFLRRLYEIARFRTLRLGENFKFRNAGPVCSGLAPLTIEYKPEDKDEGWRRVREYMAKFKACSAKQYAKLSIKEKESLKKCESLQQSEIWKSEIFGRDSDSDSD